MCVALFGDSKANATNDDHVIALRELSAQNRASADELFMGLQINKNKTRFGMNVNCAQKLNLTNYVRGHNQIHLFTISKKTPKLRNSESISEKHWFNADSHIE